MMHPDEILDDTKLNEFYQTIELTEENYFENYLNLSLFNTLRSYSSLHIPIERRFWTGARNAETVNAEYFSCRENFCEYIWSLHKLQNDYAICIFYSVSKKILNKEISLGGGGGQNLIGRNVERPVFRNFEITNIKMKKDEWFDHFIFELFFIFLETIWTPKIFNNFWYCRIFIVQMLKFKKFLNIPNC